MAYLKDSKSLKVHVKDTGSGIKQDNATVFSLFGKLKRTAKQNSDGIGLGLTVCKKIVEQCGGMIDAISDGNGTGSLFIFSMEMEAAEELEEVKIEDVITEIKVASPRHATSPPKSAESFCNESGTGLLDCPISMPL